MEAENNPNFDNIARDAKNVIQTKEYEVQINADNFTLRIDIYSNQAIHFNLKQTNKLSIYYYEKYYTYDDLTKTLKLLKDNYNDVSKVFKFYDTSITKKKVNLKEEKEKKQMILHMDREFDYDTISCNIELELRQINNEEMFLIISEEINKLNNKEKNNENKYEQKDQHNEERFKKIEEKLQMIEKERNLEKEEFKQLKEKWENEKKEFKKEIVNLNEEIKKINLLMESNKSIVKNEIKEEIKQIKEKMENEKNNLIKEIKELKQEINKINVIIENNKKY